MSRRDLDREVEEARRRLAEAEADVLALWPDPPARDDEDEEAALRRMDAIVTRIAAIDRVRRRETDLALAMGERDRRSFADPPRRGRPRRTDLQVEEELKAALDKLHHPTRRPSWSSLAKAMARSESYLRELRHAHPRVFEDLLPPS